MAKQRIFVLVFAAVIFHANAILSDEKQASLRFHESVIRASEQVERNPKLKALWNEAVERQADIELPPAEFTCDKAYKSDPPPTNVHKLQPGDINLVAALGDSITAGNGLGARHPLEVALENRGESWLIGGDRNLEEGVLTLPNIIKKFNPGLMGYSTCVSPEFLHLDREWFNVAKPGGKCNHLLSQTKVLEERMKNDKRVDYEKDWKLISIFVGGNDLCQSCLPNANYSAARWYVAHEETLLYMKANIPRAVINLISMFDVTPLQNMTKGLLCDLLQWGFCECARNHSILPTMRPLQLQYHDMLDLLAKDNRFHTDNFTVVLQPHLRDVLPPVDENGKWMKDILGPDCFHPTRVTHQGYSVWLWNTMLTPVGFKKLEMDSNDFDVPIACPTPNFPYIFTNENSKDVTAWPEPY